MFRICTNEENVRILQKTSRRKHVDKRSKNVDERGVLGTQRMA